MLYCVVTLLLVYFKYLKVSYNVDCVKIETLSITYNKYQKSGHKKQMSLAMAGPSRTTISYPYKDCTRFPLLVNKNVSCSVSLVTIIECASSIAVKSYNMSLVKVAGKSLTVGIYISDVMAELLNRQLTLPIYLEGQ